MSDQADGLRQWMKKSRAASVARDPGSARQHPHEPIHGRNGEGAAPNTSGEPTREPAIADPGAADADRGGGASFEEAVLM